MGSVLGSMESWLLLRSLRTLHIRIERQVATTRTCPPWLRDLLSTLALLFFSDSFAFPTRSQLRLSSFWLRSSTARTRALLRYTTRQLVLPAAHHTTPTWLAPSRTRTFARDAISALDVVNLQFGRGSLVLTPLPPLPHLDPEQSSACRR